MHSIKQAALAGLASFALAAPAHAYIDIVFDYRFDTSGYFTADKQEVLNQAAYAFESRFTDELTGFSSNPTGDRFSAVTKWGDVPNLSVGQNQVVIFVGVDSSNFSNGWEDSVRATGSNGGGQFGGLRTSQAFRTAVLDRGQAGGDLDASSWGGSLVFDPNANWFVDADTTTIESFAGQYDLYSTALKGMLDIFSGRGSDPSSAAWSALIDNRKRFKGANAVAENSNVPLNTQSNGGNRLQPTYESVVEGSGLEQLAVFSHGLSTGERRYLTELDYAMLADLGWEVGSLADAPPYMPAVPEPGTWAMMLAGVGLIGYVARKRRMM